MKTYAVLNTNSEVVNLIVASSLDIAEQVTSSNCVFLPLGTSAKIGQKYSDGIFSDPVEETPAEETPAEETPA